MTVLWRELRSVLTVGALSAGVILSFPLAAFDFKARPVSAEPAASAAFVTLSTEEEELLLASAKATWQDESSAMQRMRVRLPLGELPEEDVTRSFDIGPLPTLSASAPDPIAYPLPAYRPTSAAGAPSRLAAEAAESGRQPAFSKDDLLKLN